MSHSEVCPICHGKGELTTYDESSTGNRTTKTCHGCNGKGWITVEDNYPKPYQPYPPPNPYYPGKDWIMWCMSRI